MILSVSSPSNAVHSGALHMCEEVHFYNVYLSRHPCEYMSFSVMDQQTNTLNPNSCCIHLSWRPHLPVLVLTFFACLFLFPSFVLIFVYTVELRGFTTRA
jgi:hypothetical protein